MEKYAEQTIDCIWLCECLCVWCAPALTMKIIISCHWNYMRLIPRQGNIAENKRNNQQQHLIMCLSIVCAKQMLNHIVYLGQPAFLRSHICHSVFQTPNEFHHHFNSPTSLFARINIFVPIFCCCCSRSRSLSSLLLLLLLHAWNNCFVSTNRIHPFHSILCVKRLLFILYACKCT